MPKFSLFFQKIDNGMANFGRQTQFYALLVGQFVGIIGRRRVQCCGWGVGFAHSLVVIFAVNIAAFGKGGVFAIFFAAFFPFLLGIGLWAGCAKIGATGWAQPVTIAKRPIRLLCLVGLHAKK